jgi:hypothetical protein
MPILGIIASRQIGANATSYESIATSTVGAGGTSFVTFSSIPSTYKHLQIRWSNATSTSGANYVVNFNSDTSNANYAFHNVRGSGSTASTVSFASGSGNSFIIANECNYGICDIFDYSNTSKNKTTRTLGGSDFNGSGYASLNSSLWMSTSAITTIKLTSDVVGGWAQYSVIALYGIKG